MATDTKRVEELKDRGNKYMKDTPPDVERAIIAYTEALDVDEHCHTVLSNRSLAFFKLNKYQEALIDAEKAVTASPKWPKGYLRKCFALNALKKSQEAQRAAQQGFMLMHSTSFCQEFVIQWLKACAAIYTEDKLVGLLPPGPAQLCQVMFSSKQKAGSSNSIIPDGLTILSNDYWRVLFFCMASRISPLLALSHDAMKDHFVVVSNEFERTMKLFGHLVGKVVKEWADLAGEAMDPDLLNKIKPQSTKIMDKLMRHLNDDFHPTLFAVIRPLLLLAVTIINARMYTLNASNTGFYSICHMMTTCLPFFEESLLKPPEFVCHHMNLLAGLIDSYNRRATSLSNDECPVLAAHCKKLESLLPILASQFPKAYQQLRGPFEYIIGSAKTSILSKSTGVTIPFPPSSGSEDPLESAKKQMKSILQKPADLVTISDAEQLINFVEIFKTSGDINLAKESFVAAEKLLLPLMGVELQKGGMLLDDALSMTSAFRIKVLVAASLLKETNTRHFCETVVRWKGLFSEFKMVAIREGLKETFLSTSNIFHNLKSSGVTEKSAAADNITAIKKIHHGKVTTFLKDHAYRCWTTVSLFPLLPTVERVLNPDEIIIEYSFIGKYDEDGLKASLDLYIIAIKPNGTQDICIVSDRACVDVIQKWIKQWNIATAENHVGIHSDKEKKLRVVGQELSSILFPTAIQQDIKCPDVKHIYLCPEPHFCMIPFQLLPGEDGLPLFQGCTISYLGSCREIVRLEIMAQLVKEKVKDGYGNIPSKPNVVSSSTVDENTFSEKKTDAVDCCIFADPNFDHQLENPETMDDSDLWEQLYAFDPFKAEKKHCHALEHSLKEANSIEEILGLCHPNLKIHLFKGKKANLESVISLKSPLVLHFSTHGFGRLKFQFDLPDINQDDSQSGLALAGFNTYFAKNFKCVDPNASTGMLTPLTACGLDLANTRLVFLSTCVSGVGATQLQESTNSIANAFRTAGALTVIATSWSVADDATAEFVKHFYNALCQPETRPSEALNKACEELRKDPRFTSWHHWAGFSCYGDDIPVFSKEL